MGKKCVESGKFMHEIENCIQKLHGKNNRCYNFWIQSHRHAVNDKIGMIGTVFSKELLSQALVLDIGCGTGPASLAFRIQGSRVVGLDYSMNGLGLGLAKLRAVEQGVDINFVQGDARWLPFLDETFDVCFCDQVLEHIRDYKLCIEEIYRVLKENGIAYFSTPNKIWPREPHSNLLFAGWLSNRICEWYIKLRRRRRKDDVWDVQLLTYRSLASNLRKVGFEIERTAKDLINFANKSIAVRKLVEIVTSKIRLPMYMLFPNIKFLVRKRDK